MNKLTFIIGLIWASFACSGQTKSDSTNKLLTSKYAGIYSYGKDIEKERIGTIFIYTETDSTILFYVDLNRGAPSYNSGSMYGRVKIINDTGTFYIKLDYYNKGCKLAFRFTKSNLQINCFDGLDYCGFGYNVFACGEFKKTSNTTLDYFENGEGRKVYIKTTKPEDYNK